MLQQAHLPDTARPPKASTVARFTAALKLAGRRFRADVARQGAKFGKVATAAGKQSNILKLQGSERRTSGVLGMSKTGSLPDATAMQTTPILQQPSGMHSDPCLLLPVL